MRAGHEAPTVPGGLVRLVIHEGTLWRSAVLRCGSAAPNEYSTAHGTIERRQNVSFGRQLWHILLCQKQAGTCGLVLRSQTKFSYINAVLITKHARSTAGNA